MLDITYSDVWFQHLRYTALRPHNTAARRKGGQRMFCPKCGDRMEKHGDTLKCVQGEMELALHMAAGLSESFGESHAPLGDTTPRKPASHWSGWFCPGCGVSMKETPEPRGVKCPKCGRSLGKFVWGLIEHHPHRFGDEWG